MTKETSDVWFTAWLMKKGRQIKDFHITTDKKVVCRFEISEAEWAQEKVEFNNSEAAKFKSLIRQIKQMGD